MNVQDAPRGKMFRYSGRYLMRIEPNCGIVKSFVIYPPGQVLVVDVAQGQYDLLGWNERVELLSGEG